MNKIKEVDYEVVGYTVMYRKTNGERGYIGTDMHSGGYPYFSSTVDNRNVYLTPDKAENDLRMMLKSMRSYYGHSDVDFETAKVVKVSRIFEGVDSEDVRKAMFEAAKAKLSESELEIIKQELLK